MSTLSNSPRRMKTRDKIKYAFASLLALMTVVAISGLFIARHHRQQISAQEEMQIQRTLSAYGENGALPEKVELPDAPLMGGNVPGGGINGTAGD